MMEDMVEFVIEQVEDCPIIDLWAEFPPRANKDEDLKVKTKKNMENTIAKKMDIAIAHIERQDNE